MSSTSHTLAEYIAYSEWRPTRWRVKLSTGRNCGLFPSHEKAARFANGVLMNFDEDSGVEASITRIRDAAHYTWQGDNIGCGDAQAVIDFVDQFGISRSLGVADTLRQADQVDGYGLTRIVLALRCCVDELHPADQTAWLKHKAEYPVRAGGEAL